MFPPVRDILPASFATKSLNMDSRFKSFNETFTRCAFALAFALIYPNSRNLKKRVYYFIVVIFINSLILYWFLIYLFRCLFTLDMINFANNITIGVLATLFFFKTPYCLYKTGIFAKVLDKISYDMLKGNDMDEEYQEIYEHYIKIGKLGQTCWILIPILLSSQFPLYASFCMIYETFTSGEGKRYMVHEMRLKHIEDKQDETPYFELVFAYNLVQCVVLSVNFVGFDGSFCIATTHLRLKLKLVSHKIHRAFRDSKNRYELKARVIEAIVDHQDALDFYKDIQEVYGGWLFVVFLLTSLLISFNLYQIYLSRRVDPKYTIFAISGVIHMFAPCYFACKLIKSSEELSWDIYSAAWEEWTDPVVTKLLIFMIAKSQQILILTGKGMVQFDMQLFISVLQMSYSFFTLITS
ncbi:putative odorant receptor 92a [Pieris brassicae]|nr:putative odorant receptor 92a [Pieris brassicae]